MAPTPPPPLSPSYDRVLYDPLEVPPDPAIPEHVPHEEVEEASFLLRRFGIIRHPTPLYHSTQLDHVVSGLMGHRVFLYLKDESKNPTESVKDRAPIAFYEAVARGRIPSVVTTFSNGNLGSAITWAVKAAQRHTRHLHPDLTVAQVVMDQRVPYFKRRFIRHHVGHIQDYRDIDPIESYRDAEDIVLGDMKDGSREALLVSHADPHTLAGYATMAEEVGDQLRRQYALNPLSLKAGEMALLAPLGSGGLLAGLLHLKTLFPHVATYGVAAPPAQMAFDSLVEKSLMRRSIPADANPYVYGTLVTPEAHALNLIQRQASGALLVSDYEALLGTVLLREAGFHVDSTSGLALAGLLMHRDLFSQTHTVILPLAGASQDTALSAEVIVMAHRGAPAARSELLKRIDFYEERRRDPTSRVRSVFHDRSRLNLFQRPEIFKREGRRPRFLI